MNQQRLEVYIVTYKRDDVLNANLASLWAATEDLDGVHVTVLSNHPDVEIDAANQRECLTVRINATRSAYSWGNLARDWNWCMLDAFGTWRNPVGTDWCVCAQNDVTWVPGWDRWLRATSSLDLVTQPVGDQSFAINLRGLHALGFFDERFVTLQFHEQDWFTRARVLLLDRASINDGHDETSTGHHPVGEVLTFRAQSVHELRDAVDPTMHSQRHHAAARRTLMAKWRFDDDAPNFLMSVDGVAHVAGLGAALPREVDWYPFFWDGAPTDVGAPQWFDRGAESAVDAALMAMNDLAVLAFERGDPVTAARLLVEVLAAAPDHADAGPNLQAVLGSLANA